MEVRLGVSAEKVQACRELIEKEAHYLTQELWLQRDSHSRTLADLDQQQAELEESYKEAQDSNRKQHQAAQEASRARAEHERRREEMRRERVGLESKNLETSKAASVAAALLESALQEAIAADKERMARLERGALAAEKVIEELQARLREEQVALSGQREVLGGLVREREAEEAAEAQGELRRREDGLMQIRQRLAARTIQRWWRRHCKKAKKAKKGKGKKKGKAGQATGAGKKAANQKPAGSAKQPGGGHQEVGGQFVRLSGALMLMLLSFSW